MKPDFNKLKKDISLPDFMRDFYGYEPSKGSSRNSPKLSDGSNTFVVHRNDTGVYTFFDVHEPNNKRRTILDFVQMEEEAKTGVRPSLVEVGLMLEDYIKQGKTVLPDMSTFRCSPAAELSQDEIERSILGLNKSPNASFLASRGFEQETFSSPTFAKVLRSQKGGYENLAILMTGFESRAVSLRNADFNGFMGPHSETIAGSGYDKSRPVDRVVIAESMLDAMAYHELTQPKNANNLYLSSEGAVSEIQQMLFQRVIFNVEPKGVDIITDDDLYGNQLRCRLLGSLYLPQSALEDVKGALPIAQSYNFAQVNVPILGKKTPVASIEVQLSGDANTALLFTQSLVNKANGSLSELYENKPFSLSVIHSSAASVSKVAISFPNAPSAWREAGSLICSLRFANSQGIRHEPSLLKDWNDDLLLKKGLHTKFTLAPHNGQTFLFSKVDGDAIKPVTAPHLLNSAPSNSIDKGLSTSSLSI